MNNIELLLEEIHAYELECAVGQAVLDERRRVRKEKEDKKEAKLQKMKKIGLGVGFMILGFCSCFIEYDITFFIFSLIVGPTIIFTKFKI